MKEATKSTLDAALSWSVRSASLMHRNGRVAVLAYHAIGDATAFSRHLDHIEKDLQPISLDQALAAVAGRASLPHRSVLITFDDGDRSLLELAAPMMHSRGLTGVAFVVTGGIGSNVPPWWDEAEALVRVGATSTRTPFRDARDLVRTLKRLPDEARLAILDDLRRSVEPLDRPGVPQLRCDELVRLEQMGIEIGNHTETHPCLPRCSHDKIEREIRTGHEQLQQIMGHPPRAFAYPNGDWDPTAEGVLAGLGYEAAFLFDHRLSVLRNTHPLRISRLRVNSTDSLDRFRIVVAGLHPSIHHALGRP